MSASGSYYTKTDLQTSGQSSVNWGNLMGTAPLAGIVTTGLLNSTDWGTFNSKQNALGYTPAKTDGTNATGTWGISISGNATTATTASAVPWTGVTGKPTTRAGYGITDAEPSIVGGTIAQYWKGDKTWATLDRSAVGLANVDNTNDMGKPVSTAGQEALNLKANLASPGFTGTPTAPTVASSDNSTILATTAYVKGQGYLTSFNELDPKVGSLTSGYVPKWGTTSLVNGLLYDNGTNVGIGTASPGAKLDVN